MGIVRLSAVRGRGDRNVGTRLASFNDGFTDEDLILQIAGNQPEALKLLYSRYAPLIFHMAAQSLGLADAEEIVQDVFVSVWRNASTFDPQRGTLRPWLLQIAHFRILNELRRRSRRPQLDASADSDSLEELPDLHAEPVEQAWRDYRREALRAAVDRLPPSQRQALSLAFFEDLTHEQVADTLSVPLGTVKTRIRTALKTLRANLAPLGLIVILLGLVTYFGVRYEQQRAGAARTARALAMVTISDITVIHLPPAPGVAAPTHGSYRDRPGTPIAVIALENFPPAPAGKTYQGWALHNGRWTSLGTAEPDAAGKGILVGEGADFSTPPEAVEVTVEPAGGSAAPTGPAIIAWPAK
jgi:RNA polymerase sigma-70 factor, ECF subfamily